MRPAKGFSRKRRGGGSLCLFIQSEGCFCDFVENEYRKRRSRQPFILSQRGGKIQRSTTKNAFFCISGSGLPARFLSIARGVRDAGSAEPGRKARASLSAVARRKKRRLAPCAMTPLRLDLGPNSFCFGFATQ